MSPPGPKGGGGATLAFEGEGVGDPIRTTGILALCVLFALPSLHVWGEENSLHFSIPKSILILIFIMKH